MVLSGPLRILGAAIAAAAALLASACAPIALGGVGAVTGSRVAQERSVGDGLDDAGIDLAIGRKFFRTKGYDFSDVDVNVYEGRVLLTGTVRNEATRQMAAKLAWQVEDVAEVLNELELGEETPFLKGTNDGWIEARLRSRLTTDSVVTGINYEIAVSQGNVYILGVAQNQAEHERVVNHARVIQGVRKVVSHIQLADDPSRRLR